MLPAVPQMSHPTLADDDHVMSHDLDSHSSLPTLSTTLRLSIAGETLDQDVDTEPSIIKMDEDVEHFQTPGDMPVDLRVKLAVSMIQLGKNLPEVGQCRSICVYTLDDVTLYRDNYIIACDYVHV